MQEGGRRGQQPYYKACYGDSSGGFLEAKGKDEAKNERRGIKQFDARELTNKQKLKGTKHIRLLVTTLSTLLSPLSSLVRVRPRKLDAGR